MNEQYAATMKATLELFAAQEKQKVKWSPMPQQDPNHVRDAVKAGIDAMLASQSKKEMR